MYSDDFFYGDWQFHRQLLTQSVKYIKPSHRSILTNAPRPPQTRGAEVGIRSRCLYNLNIISLKNLINLRMRFDLWRIQKILISWSILTQRINYKPAIVTETGKIVEEPFCVKPDFHLGKVFL